MKQLSMAKIILFTVLPFILIMAQPIQQNIFNLPPFIRSNELSVQTGYSREVEKLNPDLKKVHNVNLSLIYPDESSKSDSQIKQGPFNPEDDNDLFHNISDIEASPLSPSSPSSCNISTLKLIFKQESSKVLDSELFYKMPGIITSYAQLLHEEAIIDTIDLHECLLAATSSGNILQIQKNYGKRDIVEEDNGSQTKDSENESEEAFLSLGNVIRHSLNISISNGMFSVKTNKLGSEKEVYFFADEIQVKLQRQQTGTKNQRQMFIKSIDLPFPDSVSQDNAKSKEIADIKWIETKNRTILALLLRYEGLVLFEQFQEDVIINQSESRPSALKFTLINQLNSLDIRRFFNFSQDFETVYGVFQQILYCEQRKQILLLDRQNGLWLADFNPQTVSNKTHLKLHFGHGLLDAHSFVKISQHSFANEEVYLINYHHGLIKMKLVGIGNQTKTKTEEFSNQTVWSGKMTYDEEFDLIVIKGQSHFKVFSGKTQIGISHKEKQNIDSIVMKDGWYISVSKERVWYGSYEVQNPTVQCKFSLAQQGKATLSIDYEAQCNVQFIQSQLSANLNTNSNVMNLPNFSEYLKPFSKCRYHEEIPLSIWTASELEPWAFIILAALLLVILVFFAIGVWQKNKINYLLNENKKQNIDLEEEENYEERL